MTALTQKIGPNGLRFKAAEILGLVPVTITLSPSEKVVHKVHLSYDVHENSYKYAPEVVTSGWSDRFPVFKPRSLESGFFRIEIPVPMRDFYNTQMKLLPELSAFLNGL